MADPTIPDVTPYIDLVLVDMDPQDLIDAALAQLALDLPEWTPREGNIEMLLIEAVAVQVAELIFAVNRIPSSVVLALLGLMGVPYDPGAKPITEIRFTLTEGNVTIPEGTQARLDLPDGQDPIVFTIDAETSVGDVLEVVVNATGDRYTDEGSSTIIGTPLTLSDSLIFVESVETAADVSEGRAAETDDGFFLRATQMFARMTNALITPAQFTSAMMEEPYIKRALAVDLTQPGNPIGDDPGHMTLVPYGDGVDLNPTQKALLAQKVEGLASADLGIHIEDPTINLIDVDVTVYKEAGFLDADVQANVETALGEYMSTATWPWSYTVRRNDLISVITNVAGVDFVSTLTTPAADVPLTGIGPLAVLDDCTVTVAV